MRAPAYSQATEPDVAERMVKAAYLFHFSTLVSWPAEAFAGPEIPLRVGVLGDDELADELSRMVASRPAGARPVNVIKLRRNQRANPHILFIGDALRAQLPELIAQFKGQPVLTVTETERALAFGSMINFISVDRTLRIEISRPAVAQSNLQVSSRLLAVSYQFTPASPKLQPQ